jgi:hypothetical protein
MLLIPIIYHDDRLLIVECINVSRESTHLRAPIPTSDYVRWLNRATTVNQFILTLESEW